ncbi:MAG TPA: hypothetical protein DC049_06450 [Spirochaetia bacterium]|nr:hypothetical protein [Spirochaetia bacterium]
MCDEHQQLDEDYDNIDINRLIDKCRKITDNSFNVYNNHPYYAAREVDQKLGQFYDKARMLLKTDKLSALAYFSAVIESVWHNIGEVDDSDGGLSGTVDLCIDELGKLLPEINLPAGERNKWQKRIFRMFEKNDYGVGDDLDQLLLDTCKKEDAEFMINLGQNALNNLKIKSKPENDDDTDENEDDYHSKYTTQRFAVFIASLYKINDNQEIILDLYKNLRLHFDYVMELLNQKKITESTEYADTNLSGGYDINRFAEALIENKYKNETLVFLESITKKIKERIPYYEDIFEKLAKLYEWKKDFNKSLDIYFMLYKQHPQINLYKETERVGAILDVKDKIKEEIISFLKEKNDNKELVETYLYLKELEAALEYLKKENRYYGDIHLRVALACEQKYPDEAINIYKAEIQSLINRASRSYYSETVKYFKKIQKLSGPEIYQNYVNKMREENKRRPAFIDEIRKV